MTTQTDTNGTSKRGANRCRDCVNFVKPGVLLCARCEENEGFGREIARLKAERETLRGQVRHLGEEVTRQTKVIAIQTESVLQQDSIRWRWLLAGLIAGLFFGWRFL